MCMLAIGLGIAAARGQSASAPAASPPAAGTQPATPPAKKRDRNFNGSEPRPPMIWAIHVSDEVLALLCADLYLDEATTALAKSLHDTYMNGLRTLAEEQDERMYQWQLKTEEELAGPEIVLEPGQRPMDLPRISSRDISRTCSTSRRASAEATARKTGRFG